MQCMITLYWVEVVFHELRYYIQDKSYYSEDISQYMFYKLK